MCKVFNFESVSLSQRNGIYGGTEGKKEGVLINNENWIIKYPKRIDLKNTDVTFYTSSPLSEYIGSHVYEILGFDVQKTALGIRHNRVVVACKDFCVYPGELREMRTIKNTYYKKRVYDWEYRTYIKEKDDLKDIEIQELLLEFKHNPILKEIEGVEERFWDCLLVDGLIKNSDRSDDNWGVLFRNNLYRLAPVFDNDAAFYNRLSDEQIEKIMGDDNELKNNSLNIMTTYGGKKQQYNLEYFLSRHHFDGLEYSLKKIVPIIVERFPEIKKMINDIPEQYNGIKICSSNRKRFYIEDMKIRINELFVPIWKNLNEKTGVQSPYSMK